MDIESFNKNTQYFIRTDSNGKYTIRFKHKYLWTLLPSLILLLVLYSIIDLSSIYYEFAMQILLLALPLGLIIIAIVKSIIFRIVIDKDSIHITKFSYIPKYQKIKGSDINSILISHKKNNTNQTCQIKLVLQETSVDILFLKNQKGLMLSEKIGSEIGYIINVPVNLK